MVNNPGDSGYTKLNILAHRELQHFLGICHAARHFCNIVNSSDLALEYGTLKKAKPLDLSVTDGCQSAHVYYAASLDDTSEQHDKRSGVTRMSGAAYARALPSKMTILIYWSLRENGLSLSTRTCASLRNHCFTLPDKNFHVITLWMLQFDNYDFSI